MAEKFTILPNFAQQESNTAVLQDGGFTDELLTSMRTKRAIDDAKHEKTQQELASSIDFKTGDIFDVDLKVIDRQKQEYLDWISANAEKIASHDLATLAKQKEWKGKIDMQVDKAIGRKQWYDKQTIYLTSPDGTKLGYGEQRDFDKLKKYKETALGEWEGYDERNMFNEYDFFKDYNIEPQERVDDNGVTKITYSQTPAEDIITVGQQKINTPEGRKYRENMLDLANAAKNKQTVNATIEYYDIEDFKKNGDKATVKTIQLSELTPDNIDSIIYFKKNALDTAYQNSTKKDVIAPTNPKSDDSNGSNLPDGYSNQDVDKSFEILNGTGGTSSKGEVYKTSYKVTYENGKKVSKEVGKEKIDDSNIVPLGGGSLTVTLKDNNGRDKEYAISNIIKVGDKLYFGVKGADGKYEMTPNYEIKDYFQDVLQPIYNRQYQATGNAAKALTEAQIYAWQTDPVSAAKLGYPKPLGINLNNSTNTTSTTNNTSGAGRFNSPSTQKKNNVVNNQQPLNNSNKFNAPKTQTTTTAPTTTNIGAVKSQQPQNDITNNYLNVLVSQYKSMGESNQDAYKNSWQYRPQEIDKKYDEFAKTDNKREKGNLLTNAGYKSIDAFENSKGTAQGTSMNKGDGYSKTQEAEIKNYVENNIGMDIWNKLPEKLQTQFYSMAFNAGTKYDRDITDGSGKVIHKKGDERLSALQGLAQALAPDKIKTDDDRLNLTADEAKSIIKNYFK